MMFKLIESHYERRLSIKKPRLDYSQALKEIDEKDAIVKRLSWVGSTSCLLRCGGRLYRISGELVGCEPITENDKKASDYVVLKYYK